LRPTRSKKWLQETGIKRDKTTSRPMVVLQKRIASTVKAARTDKDMVTRKSEQSQKKYGSDPRGKIVGIKKKRYTQVKKSAPPQQTRSRASDGRKTSRGLRAILRKKRGGGLRTLVTKKAGSELYRKKRGA